MKLWPFRRPLLEILGIVDPEADRAMNRAIHEIEDRAHRKAWADEQRKRLKEARQ
jgi:hypothetical protein